MNNKGFTMIELLASMVLLSILMLVAVPTVLKMMDETRRKTIVNDSKKLVAAVEYKIKNNNNYIKKPRSANECIVVTLGYLNLGNEFNEGPHGGAYSLDDSFVIVQYDPTPDDPHVKQYNYYVTLVEKYEQETYYGLFLYPYEKISERGATGYVDGFNKDNLLSDFIGDNTSINTKLKAFKVTTSSDTVSDICGSVEFKNESGGSNDKVYDTQDALDEVNVVDPNEE